MLKKLFNNKGNTMIELLMVMMIITLFGVTIYTLIYTGSETQKKVIAQKDAQVDARIAMSYVNVRLRQSDEADKVSIEKMDETGENAIVIKERGFDADFDTWIYFSNGELKESLVDPGEQPIDKPGMYTPIASITGFSTDADAEGVVTTEIIYSYGDKVKSLANVVRLKCFNIEAEE